MKIITNQNGFTYILALTIVIIMGIMLGMVGQSWQRIKQRELEEEMIFRGDQVAELVYQRLLCKNAKLEYPAANQFLWPVNNSNGTILDGLVKSVDEPCANNITKKFRLRPSASLNPWTGLQWQIVNPIGDNTRFAGVMSDSSDEPLRQNFSSIYDTQLLDDKKHYNEWQFTWELKKNAPQNQSIKR